MLDRAQLKRIRQLLSDGFHTHQELAALFCTTVRRIAREANRESLEVRKTLNNPLTLKREPFRWLII
jgi:hypothetical protein